MINLFTRVVENTVYKDIESLDQIPARLKKKLRDEIEEKILTEKDSEVDILKKKIKSLESDKDRLVGEKKELELQKKLEERDIESLLTEHAKKMEIEKKEYKLELEKQFVEKERKIRDEYHKKKEGDFNNQMERLEKVNQSIMALVPKIEVGLKGKLS